MGDLINQQRQYLTCPHCELLRLHRHDLEQRCLPASNLEQPQPISALSSTAAVLPWCDVTLICFPISGVFRSEYIKQLVQTSIEDNYDTLVVYTKRPNFPSVPFGSLGTFITGLRNDLRRLRIVKKPLTRLSLADLDKVEGMLGPATFAMLVRWSIRNPFLTSVQQFTHAEFRQRPIGDWSAGLYAKSADFVPSKRDDVLAIKALVRSG